MPVLHAAALPESDSIVFFAPNLGRVPQSACVREAYTALKAVVRRSSRKFGLDNNYDYQCRLRGDEDLS